MDSENDDYVDIIFDDTGTNNAASPLGPLSPSTSSENGDYINIVDDDNNMIAPNARLPPIPIAPLARRQPKRPSSAPLSDTDGWDFESGALFGDDSDAYLSDFLGDSNSDSFDSNNDWDIDNDADIDDDDTYDEEVDDDDDDNAFTPKAHTSHTSRKARKVGNVRKARKGPKGRKAVKDFPKPSKPSKAPLPVPDKMARARITRFCRITKLISSSRLDAAIQDAVKRTQCAVEQATMVLKLMILERFEELTAGEGTNGFTHATARTMANDKIFGFSASLFRRLLSCVAREVAHRGEGRSVGTRELDARIRRAFDDNADLFGERVSGLHLSEVFGIEAFQFQASYKQNIKTHFTKYVRRCTRALVAEATRATIDVLPANARTAALKRCAQKWIHYVYGGVVPDDVHSTLDVQAVLIPQLRLLGPPTLRDTRINFVYDLAANPHHYLPYMVHMNRILEESSARLFSPLPLRTTLIQRHIRINTGTLVRLWPYELTSRQQFLERLRSALGTLCPGVVFDLSGIRNRYTLVPEKAVRTGGLRLPDKFSAIFSTAIWMSVTKLSATVPPNGRRNKRPPMRSVEVGPLPVKQVLVFGNSMSTDGFQTSLGYVDESQLGLTRYTGADRGGAFVPDDPPYVNDLDNNARTALLDKYTLLGADPGKRSLLTLGSGHRKDRQPPANQDGVDPVDVDGNNNDGGCIKARFEWVAGTREALRDPDYVGQGRAKQPKYEGDLLDYKATVRADEAGHTRNAAEARNQMANYKASTTIDIKAIETSLGTNGRSACSCMLESFRGYLLRRQQVLASLRVYYATKSHRRRRYRSLIGSKSSIDKFVARIKAKYTVQSGETGEDVPIAIMYGDWSNPNGFRGGGPTLSVGLRRALSLIFVLVLVNEFRTSSCCPVCMGPVMHPLNRVTIRLPPASDAHPHPNDDGPRETRAPVHHLLRCPRAECKSQWWNRDALAVANITAKALRVLRHEPQHQVYGPDGVDNPNTPEQES